MRTALLMKTSYKKATKTTQKKPGQIRKRHVIPKNSDQMKQQKYPYGVTEIDVRAIDKNVRYGIWSINKRM